MLNTIKNIFIGIVVLAALSGIALHIYSRIQVSAPLPEFSFTDEKASGWWSSDNINVQAVARSGAYQGEEPIDKLPIADLTVHHRTSNTSVPTDNCFATYTYYDRQLDDVSAAYQDYIEKNNQLDGKVEKIESLKLSFSTFEGDKNYTLEQYRLTAAVGEDTLRGYQVGFAPLSSGYIRIEGVCKTYEDLALILPTMNSVQLLDR